jgi:hypothetical protein
MARAGLDGERQPLALGRPDGGQGGAVAEVRDVRAAAGAADGLDHRLDVREARVHGHS